MKNKIFTMLLIGCMTATALSGCGKKTAEPEKPSITASISEEATETVSPPIATSSDSAEDTQALAPEDIEVAITGIEDRMVVQDAKDINYLHGILYDKDIVTEVTVDDSNVDLASPGVYDIIYKVTINRQEYDTYKEVEHPKPSIELVEVPKTIEVVTPEEAVDIADEGKVVWGDENKPVANSKGEEVKEPDLVVPQSTIDKETKPLIAETKEEYEVPVENPDEKKDEKDKDKDDAEDEKKAEDSKKSEGVKTAENVEGDSKKENSNPQPSTPTKTPTKAPTKTSDDNKGSSKSTPAPTPKPSSNSSSQTKHVHNWTTVSVPEKSHMVHHDAVTHTVHHDAVTHTVHHDAVTHEEPVYTEVGYYVCNTCGTPFTDIHALDDHQYSTNDEHGGYHTTIEKIQSGSQTITDSQAWDEVVTDKQAWDEKIVDKAAYSYQKCTDCNAIK